MAFADPKKIIEQLGIEPTMEVADFGVGGGYFAVVLADKVGDDGKVYAIDIQEELLTKARNHDHGRHDNISFLQGDLEEENGSGLAAGIVDMVLLANTLFQFENKEAGLKEAHRVLKPGGMLALVDWSESFGGLGPQSEHVLQKTDAQALASKAGFSIVREIEAGDHHYGLVFKK